MATDERVNKAVFSAVDELNAQLPAGVTVEKSLDAPLYGAGGKLESLDFVTLIMEVEEKIKNLLQTNAVLQKLIRGDSLDEFDIQSLADTLRSEDPYITEELLQRVYDNRTARFIDFIRHILGLQKLRSRTEVIAQSFDDFIARHNDYTADQIRFLLVLKTFVTDKGRVVNDDLIAQPFTNLHPQGIRGVFNPAELTEILEFVDKLG